MASKDENVRMTGLSAPQTTPEAALEDGGVRGVDEDVDPSPADELEAGIAAVFDAIRSGKDNPADGADADDPPPEDSGVTFALLTELNRLWDRPPV